MVLQGLGGCRHPGVLLLRAWPGRPRRPWLLQQIPQQCLQVSSQHLFIFLSDLRIKIRIRKRENIDI